MGPSNFLKHPFGEESCETEAKILKNNYQKLYFEETAFNRESLRTGTYLIVGRCGSGKTSLSHYFKFQDIVKNARCIDVDEPDVYANVLSLVSRFSASDANGAISRIMRIWEYVFWTLIFSQYQNEDPDIKAACVVTEPRSPHFIRSILNHLVERFLSKDAAFLSEQLEHFLASAVFKRAKQKLLAITELKPVIVAIDALEKYAVDNTQVMMSLAALIQCSRNFNVEYAHRGVHIKTFISAEIFTYITENVMGNTPKYLRNPVFINWRPKDLMRLTSWRFYGFLRHKKLLDHESAFAIDWANYHNVLAKVWNPYFGFTITGSSGLSEKTFPYILRHTQMRPRQVIVLCNAIARKAMQKRLFPYFYRDERLIAETVKSTGPILANDVINAYAGVYPNVSKILDALHGTPTVFKGRWLDKIASKTAAQWSLGDYSPTRFKQILVELGIVGVIRQKNNGTRIIEADFDYNMMGALTISPDDDCVLHPMFFEKFSGRETEKAIIYPFPNHPDYASIHD